LPKAPGVPDPSLKWHRIFETDTLATRCMSEILMNDSPLFSSEVIENENETELIPLITAEDEELMNAEKTPPELPILPLRNTVLFPGVVIPITVGRDRSIRLIQEVYRGNRTLASSAKRTAISKNRARKTSTKWAPSPPSSACCACPMAVPRP
jgi:hypothetical protein